MSTQNEAQWRLSSNNYQQYFVDLFANPFFFCQVKFYSTHTNSRNTQHRDTQEARNTPLPPPPKKKTKKNKKQNNNNKKNTESVKVKSALKLGQHVLCLFTSGRFLSLRQCVGVFWVLYKQILRCSWFSWGMFLVFSGVPGFVFRRKGGGGCSGMFRCSWNYYMSTQIAEMLE